MHVQGVVEIDAGQDGEHIGLQERDEDLETGEGHHEGERRPAAEEAERHDEGAEHFQHGVARPSCWRTAGPRAKRAREIGDHLDHHQQRQHDERHALGHEELQEIGAVLPEADAA